MVIYNEDGTPNAEHENYLNAEARFRAALCGTHEAQVDVANRRLEVQSDARVQFVMNKQRYRTAYAARRVYLSKIEPRVIWRHYEYFGEELEAYRKPEVAPFPEKGIDRETLMKCSGLADSHFTFNPNDDKLRLPIEWVNTLYGHYGQMAPINKEPLVEYIIPWLEKMEVIIKRKKKGRKVEEKDIPRMETPDQAYLLIWISMAIWISILIST